LCIIREDQHTKAHRRSKRHLLTPALKEIRRTRTERLRQWHAKNGHNILFTDLKIFTIEEQYNHQNKTYAQTSLEVRSEGAGRPSSFLRHGLVVGVPSGRYTSSFLRERVKLVNECNKRTCHVHGVVKPLNTTLFNGHKWVFQQDSAPAHKAKTTQEWLRGNLLVFISAENWLSGNPDLKPLDCKLWTLLKDIDCRKRHNNTAFGYRILNGVIWDECGRFGFFYSLIVIVQERRQVGHLVTISN
jgi:inhibitor of nuclear factor kappa-B kinase subunit alpha